MGLPVLGEQEYDIREVPYQEFAKRAQSNFKTPRHEGVSNLGKPDWLKIRPPSGEYKEVKDRLSGLGLVTVCAESHCPNISECWSGGTATFMVLGDTCTRSCGFCHIKTGRPPVLDVDEPRRVADALKWTAAPRVWMLGSSGVYGEADGGWVDEDTPPAPRHRAGEVQVEAEEALQQRAGSK